MPRSFLLLALVVLALSVCSTFWLPKRRLISALRFFAGANLVFGLSAFFELSSRGAIFFLPAIAIGLGLLLAGGIVLVKPNGVP